jgi:hypothetical protein
MLGASRGEDGIRQALLRDPTYAQTVQAAVP